MSNPNAKTSLGGDVVRLTMSKVITLVVTMITSMLLARFRTKEEYGIYSELLLVVNLVSSLMMLGLPNSINFFLVRAETQEEKRKFLSVYYTLNTVLSIFMGMALVLAIPLIEKYFHNHAIRTFYYFLAVYPWTSVISASVENILVVYQKTKILILYRLAFSVAMMAAVVGVQALGLGFTEYMISFIVVNSAFALWVYWIAFKLSGGLHPFIDKPLIKVIFKFSIPIGMASMVGTLNSEIDKLLIGYLMDTEQMAIYTNAAKELPLTIVATSITAVLLPKMTLMIKKKHIQEAVGLWGCATELAFIIIAFVVAGVFTYAEETLTILYSAKYLPGVMVFRIYTLNLLFRVTYFGIVLNAYGETKKILYCSIASLLLNVILNPLFYKIFGMIGPAIATLIVIFLLMILQLLMTANVSAIPLKSILPWNGIFKVLLLNICLAVVFWILKRTSPLDAYMGNIGEAVCLGVIWFAVYILLVRKKMVAMWHRLNQEDTVSGTW